MDIQEFARQLVDDTQEAAYFVDTNRTIRHWNIQAEKLTGFSAREVVGHSCSDNILVHVDDEGVYMCAQGCPLAETMRTGEEKDIEAYMHHRQGHRLPVTINATPVKSPEGDIVGCLETFSLKTAQAKLAMMASVPIKYETDEEDFSPVTPQRQKEYRGVLDREEIEGDIQRNIDELHERNEEFGLIFAEVENAADIRHEHVAADVEKMCASVEKTIESNIGPNDLVGRWEENCFVIVLDIMDENQLESLSKKLKMLVATSFMLIDNSKVTVTIRTGSTLGRPNDTIESIVKRAKNLSQISGAFGPTVASYIEDEDKKSQEEEKAHKKKKKRKESNEPTITSGIRPGIFMLFTFIVLFWIFVVWIWHSFYRYR